ncbi:hypothetical protein BLA17378_07774 [Burkholderia aenigmatica]|uniref:Uncharacterized protein n=2 Tax=Burkholderia TaxID=32008 RepID=A0ABY6Y8V7_9BURK|nr:MULTISPECIES: hypothetical protein [Burkholderia]VWD37234.1 hypothetical protein BLA17378_07774 [Burkholderia aenigmatica]VWD52704.1 hypothetical protein BLA18628_06206 [Burkholderia aenigmatica]
MHDENNLFRIDPAQVSFVPMKQLGDIKMVMFDSDSAGLTIVLENGDKHRLEQRYSATHLGFGNGYGGAFITLAALLLAQHELISALERAAAVESTGASNV